MALQNAEMRYQLVEKVVLKFVYAVRDFDHISKVAKLLLDQIAQYQSFMKVGVGWKNGLIVNRVVRIWNKV